MKLISLYIENFGGLHQYSLEFSEGLTVIREANGFGKTTLAEFIRAMFYGFPRKAKTLDKNRRQKYTPWQGGKFGGNLTFQLDGTQYRIERTFGATPKGDRFNLIDLTTNKKSDRFSEEIGQELFGLDGDSFERSTYMPQLREKIGLTTDSIRAKLGDLVEDTGDVGNFEKAVTALKNKRSTFIPYRGSGGAVAEASAQISRLQEELDIAAAREGELEACRVEIAELETALEDHQAKLAGVRREITAASERAASTALHGQYRAMKERSEEIEARLEELQMRYPWGMPTEDAVEQAIQIEEKRAVLLARNVTSPEEEAAVRFLRQHQSRFAEGVPADGELESCRISLMEYQNLQAELKNTALSQGEQEQYRQGKQLRDSGALDEERLEKLARDHRELEKVRDLLENLEPPAEDAAPPSADKRNPFGVILLALGFAAMAAGVALLALSRPVPGGVALGAGVLMLLGGIFGTMKAMMARELARQHQAQARSDRQGAYAGKRLELEEQARLLEAALFRELGRGDFRQAVEDLRLTRSRWLDLQEKADQIQQKREALGQRIQEAEHAIGAFLEKYCDDVAPERFYENLTELQRTAEGCRRAKVTLDGWNQRKSRWEAETAECDGMLADFCHRWKLPVEGDLRSGLRQVQDDCRRWEDLSGQKVQLDAELEAFEMAHGPVLSSPVPEELPDTGVLEEQEEAVLAESADLTRRLLQKRQLAQNLRNQTERIPELQSQLEGFRLQKTEGQNNARLLDETVEFLQMAKDSLSSSYLGPIQGRFRAYLEELTGMDDRVLVTGDLDVQLERQGEARELGYFSAGQMDAVMLCMRFALVDALFTGEKPFVILDDPFVNLDDAHTAQALELLRKLAGDRQVIYLVCHSSRAV